MAKKVDARASAEPSSRKRLDRKLAKLEGRLAAAADKRDRAQARVDALTIMADEIRASIAAAEQPAPKAAPTKAPAAEARASAPSAAPRKRPAATKRSTATSTRRSPTRTTRAASSSARRRRPASGGPPATSS